MKRLFQASLLLLVLVAGSTPLLAHHGNASYENKEVTIKGKVTQWLWTNPHSFLMVDVTDENGKVVHWICENQRAIHSRQFWFHRQDVQGRG